VRTDGGAGGSQWSENLLPVRVAVAKVMKGEEKIRVRVSCERWRMMMWHHLIGRILSCWMMTHVNMWLDRFES